MDSINKIRLLAGLPVDLARMVAESRGTKSYVSESREVPKTRSELAPENHENHSRRVESVKSAVQLLKQAITTLEGIPSMDFNGEIPHYIHAIEEIVSCDKGESGLETLVPLYSSAHKKWKDQDDIRVRAEQEEENVSNSADDAVDHHEDHEDRIDSAQKFEKGDAVSYHDKPMIVVVPNEGGDYVGVAPEGQEEEVGAIKLVHSNELEVRDHNNIDDEDSMELHNHDLSDDPEDEDDNTGLEDDNSEEDFDEDPEIAALGNFKDDVQDEPGVGASIEDKSNIKIHRLGEAGRNFYYDTEEEEGNPIDVSDGTSNANQIWKGVTAKDAKNENPNQLRSLGAASKTDIDRKVKIPASIKAALKKACDDVETGFKRLGAAETDAHFFYNSILNAFMEVLGFLEAGTVYDIKQAQIFWSSLQSPIQHKFPDEVVNFLLRGGEAKKLKDYMKPVTDYPITGVRDTLK